MADKKQEGGIGKALKKYLITGVLVWTPIAVTVWVIGYIISATDQLAALIPAQWQPERYLGFHLPGTGFLVAVVVLLITGVFAANMLGRKILEGWDLLLGRIPVVKSIYSSVKKVSESLFSDNSRSFKAGYLDDRIRIRCFSRKRCLRSASTGRLYSRLCTDHAQSDRRLLHHGEKERRARTRHERGRRIEICDFAGHGDTR